MWFKNIQIYRFEQDFSFNPSELSEALEKSKARSCSQLERQTFGFTPPLGTGHEALVETVNGCYLFACAKREKLLPPSVVREIADERALLQSQNEGRPLSRREVRSIIDEVTLELLPKALSKTSVTYAYFDSKNKWLVIDSSSQKKADEITILLRDCLGSLPAVVPQTKTSVMFRLTEWVAHDRNPQAITIDDFCELQKQDKEKSVIRCQQHEVACESIRQHIDNGMQVTKLALTWRDRLSFVLEHDFSIKKIKFLDLVQSMSDDINAETQEEQFAADFSILTAEFADFIPDLAAAFDGFVNDIKEEASTMA